MALFFMQLHKALKRVSHSVGLHEHKTPVLSGQTCQAGIAVPAGLLEGQHLVNVCLHWVTD